MINETDISWTDFTVNPLRYRDKAGNVVWACVKTSPGCAGCYAERLAKRFKRGGPFTKEVMAGLTPFLDAQVLEAMFRSEKISGKRVFVGDMTDVFGEWVPDALIAALLVVLIGRADVTWQVLTKRADRMRRFFEQLGNDPVDALAELHNLAGPVIGDLGDELRGREAWDDETDVFDDAVEEMLSLSDMDLPPRNLHLGVSCERQEEADERIPDLQLTPAAVRFVSVEPQVAAVDLEAYLEATNVAGGAPDQPPGADRHYPAIDWVICGGESGPDLAWARALLQQCREAGVPFHLKQFGRRVIDTDYLAGVHAPFDRRSLVIAEERGAPLVDGERYVGFNLVLTRHRQGGDPNEWPSDLRVREFPRPTEEP
jgi:protein gp37